MLLSPAELGRIVVTAIGEALAAWITGETPLAGMMDLAPGRFGPLTDDALVSRGLWQYAHYYDPMASELA